MQYINVITQLVTLVTFSLAMHLFNIYVLSILALTLIMLLLYSKNTHFFKMMKKLKWLFLFMFIILSFNTPGQHFLVWPFDIIKPSYEGVHGGLMQVLRITLMLAALSVLLTKNSRQELISGFYFVSYPFRFFGLDVERFAARLLLTLHYAEIQQVNLNKASFKEKVTIGFDQLFMDSVDSDVLITIKQPDLNVFDYLLLIICIIFTINFLIRLF